MALTLSSTLQNVLDQFVKCSPAYDPANSQMIVDATSVKIFWPDTSRVRLDISVMSLKAGGVAMAVPPVIHIPGGDNPNNPPPPPGTPPVLTTLAPSSIAHGGSGFDLVITGTGFVDDSSVNFGSAIGNGVYVSPTQMNFHVDAIGYQQAGTMQVSVAEPGGSVSNQLPFTIS